MTEEKICPFMSRPEWVDDNPPHRINEHIEIMTVPCQREKCIAWEVREYRGGFGHCRLIERGA